MTLGNGTPLPPQQPNAQTIQPAPPYSPASQMGQAGTQGTPLPQPVGPRQGPPQIDFSEYQQGGPQPLPQQPPLPPHQQFAQQIATMPAQPQQWQQPQYPPAPAAPQYPQYAATPPQPGMPPSPAPQPQQQQGTPGLRELLAARGIPVDSYATDEQMLADLTASASERSRLEALARYGQAALANQGQQQQQSAPQQTQQPAQPEWREEWGALLQRDPDTGLYVPKPGNEIFASQIAQLANQREADRRAKAEHFMRDPVGFIMEQGLQQRLQQEREQMLQELRQQEADRQLMAQAQEFRREMEPLVFQRDQSGQVVVNPLTRQPMLTQFGQQVQQEQQRYAHWFQSAYGVEPDESIILEHVRPMISAYKQQVAQQQPAFNPAQNEAWKQQVQYGGQSVAQAAQAAMFQPQPNGTVAAAAYGVPQNSQIPFAEQLRQEAIQQGIMHPREW